MLRFEWKRDKTVSTSRYETELRHLNRYAVSKRFSVSEDQSRGAKAIDLWL